ncbi:hypothetical protein HOLleu_41247 [Holothuria leucospilota]|uniref:Uncharacterized protein n=1 Tax=Holothuria leucospilota TaxID=206669 RepID=A0A9Q0YBB2_HOLLE|nr:hypothetical protein HOLleu_41247 [Holothuria leucospilota]
METHPSISPLLNCGTIFPPIFDSLLHLIHLNLVTFLQCFHVILNSFVLIFGLFN